MAQNQNNTEYIIGIRREDKNKWEKRTPLVPDAIRELQDVHGIKSIVQPCPIRIHPDKDYADVGAEIQEDLSGCNVIFAVKEIPEELFEQGKTYVFFSHTIKGQLSNIPMLKRILALGCTLIDYEKITDPTGKRIIFFGRHAGLAGMVDTLWAFGRRLAWEKIDNPFSMIRHAFHYNSLEQAKEAVIQIGEEIIKAGLPDSLCPCICGFAGYGNVSNGAQEIYDLLPVEKIAPSDLHTFIQNGKYSREKVYKVIFKEEDLVRPSNSAAEFNLDDYYHHPEKYHSQFEQYIPYLKIFVNAIYWDERYPKLVTRKYLKNLFDDTASPRLRVIGDISCDVEGAVECNMRATTPDNPVYVFNPLSNETIDGVEGKGVVVMAVDNLPCEFPREASIDFSTHLKQFVPAVAHADYTVDFSECKLPEPIRKAVIVYRGKLTPDFSYINDYL